MNELESIKKIVGNGQSKKAIEKLVSFLKENDSDLLNSAIIVQSKISEFEISSKIERTITTNEADIMFNQINKSILGIIGNYEHKIYLEYKVKNYAKKLKINIYIYIVLLFVVFTLSTYLVKIFNESEKYKKELIKKEEYMKILELQSIEIINIGNNLKNDIPQISKLLEEYKNLYFQHTEAVKDNNLILKSEILQKNHNLPKKYELTTILRKPINTGVSQQIDMFTAELATFNGLDTTNRLIFAPRNNDIKRQIIIQSLKRGKLSIEEIAADFSTTVDFVLKIKEEENL